MSRLYLVSFVAIAGLAIVGVDYSIQARTTGAGLTGLGPGGYVDTIKTRYGQHQADRAAASVRKDLLARNERDLLPPSPEGWVRRDYTEADRAQLEVDHDPMGTMPADARNSILGKMVAAQEVERRERDARQVFVYEKEDALIALRLDYRDPGKAPGGITGAAMDIVKANMEAMSDTDIFALVRGVAFRAAKGRAGEGATTREYRVISGQIGGEVSLVARAVAADEDILALLDTIDYDRLNAMLTAPVAGIGSEAPDTDPVLGAVLAERMVAAERAALFARGAAQEANLSGVATTMQDPEASALAKATSMLGVMFGSGEKDAEAAATEARTAVGDIRVNRSAGPSGFGVCTTEGGVKRCRIGE